MDVPHLWNKHCINLTIFQAKLGDYSSKSVYILSKINQIRNVEYESRMN